jgi:hypothetical protein
MELKKTLGNCFIAEQNFRMTWNPVQSCISDDF